MNIFRIAIVTFSLTLLVACGGGGGGGTAAPTPQTPTTPTVNPLTVFRPTEGSPSIQAVQEITEADGVIFSLGRAHEAGSTATTRTTTCSSGVCTVDLPTITSAEFTLTNSTPNLSFVNESLNSANSRITNTQTVGDITFARGSLTGTKNSTRVEFQTFSGWLDGSIFGITQVAIGESGGEEYRFIPYNAGVPSPEINPSGTGMATWEGIVVAVIKADGTFIRGDSELTIPDLATPRIGLTFDNWRMIDGQAISNIQAITFDAGPPVIGTFSNTSNDGTISGRFYGTNHEEVAGRFNAMNVSGAFGATRQP